jgi:hypothetical protein
MITPGSLAAVDLTVHCCLGANLARLALWVLFERTRSNRHSGTPAPDGRN